MINNMISPEFIGRWHNESLKHIALDDLNQAMNRIALFLVEQGLLDSKESEVVIASLKQAGLVEWIAWHPQFIRPYPSADEVAFVNAAEASLDLLLKSQYSKQFRTALTKIITIVPTTTSLNGFVAYAETELGALTNDAESEIVQTVLAVIRKSKEYLDRQGMQKIKPGSWVIIGDFVGAMVGTLGGPFGSIILGAAVSYLVNEKYGS